MCACACLYVCVLTGIAATATTDAFVTTPQARDFALFFRLLLRLITVPSEEGDSGARWAPLEGAMKCAPHPCFPPLR